MTTAQALSRLQKMCSRSEKCTADVQKKLYDWGVSKKEAAGIVAILQKQGFVNDGRYAKAFVRDKNKFSHWGVVKIKQALQVKNILPEIVSEALQELDMEAYRRELEVLLIRKNAALKSVANDNRKAKLLRFALSKGYEYAMAYEAVMHISK